MMRKMLWCLAMGLFCYPFTGKAQGVGGRGAEERTIGIDFRKTPGKLNTMFRECIGAGRAGEGLRADWQQQLAYVRKECGFNYIRMHGLLSDDMGVYSEDEHGKPEYNFMYIDVLFDFLHRIGMKPFVELGFMPSRLASGDRTIFWWRGNVTPPKDYGKWEGLIQHLVEHFTDRYGVDEVKTWYFEVWNEPNLSGFWTGTQDEYFKLYTYAAKAIKGINTAYRVGGPATAGAAWEPEMIRYCSGNKVPIDFISTHSYGVKAGYLDEFGQAGTVLDKNPMSVSGDVLQSRREIAESSMPGLELHYTEWSSSYTPADPLHDSYHEAAYILQKLKQVGGAANSMSYWVFTDIFEEPGPRFTPFHGGFGLLTIQGINKPAFYAYQFLNRLGDKELVNTDSSSWVCKDSAGNIQALVWDFTNTHPGDSVHNQVYYTRDLPARPKGRVTLRVDHVPGGMYALEVYRVGYRSNDAYSTYLSMGKPAQLDRQQVAQIEKQNDGSPISREVITIKDGETFSKRLDLRENDVYFLNLIKLTSSSIYPSYNTSPLTPDSTGMTSTAMQLVSNISVGWNIGNTMEAPGGETGWGNPPITAAYVNAMKNLGFNAVRIPCAWDFHVDNKSTAHIDESWLNRVHEVVQYCVSNNMYVMLNIHWDGGWLDCAATGARMDSINAKQKAFWEQIATKMRDFDEHLMFASANEPSPTNAAQMNVLLSYHQSFVDAVRSTGGHNSYRVLIVQAPSNLINNFPVDPTPGRMAFEEHDYTPSQFTILDADASWGNMSYYWSAGHHSTIEPDRNAIWGEEDYLMTYFENMKAKFVDKGIPFLMGEYGAYRRTTPKDLTTHNDAVDYWITFNTKQAIAHGLKPFWWDTGGFVDRKSDTVIDARTVNAIFAGATTARSQPINRFFPEKDLVSTGIYYYPEHWKEEQWERDIARIAEMGYGFVHLAEFAWFRLEPEEGKFDFAWLDKVMGLCAKYKLKVLMCTPSATTPAWMRDKYPKTFVMDGHYIRGEHGTRGLGSIANLMYRRLVERIVAEMGRRYGRNENVIGWQLDNEPDAKPDYSPSSQEAFRQWLKNKYKTVGALNAAWGTAFWSQWYTDFDQVIIPNTTLVGWWGNNPHALLDLKRYSADTEAEFLDFEAGILRKYISADQFVTTNYTAVSTGSDPRRTKKLDFATYTAYPNGGTDNLGDLGFRLGNSRVILFASEYFKSVGGASGVMEIQPGPVNWGSYNPLLLPGTVRMWLYHSFAAGGRLACSYRFRQINYSAEQYHAGVIKTDGVTPSPGGEEYMQFMKEVNQLRQLYKPGRVMPEKLAARSTAVLWDLENFWSIDRQKQTFQWDAWNYPVKFVELAKGLGAPVAVVGPTADLSKYRVVIVPAYEMVDSPLVKKWQDYVSGGGHLIITCRTATKDRQGHFWEAGWAAPISGLIGAHVKGSDMLPGNANGDVLMGSMHYRWNNWADLLEPDTGTEVPGTYDNQFYKGTPAVVKRKIGKGTVTYIGVDTDGSDLEKTLLRDTYVESGASTEEYPPGVYVYWRDGFYIAVNYSSGEYAMPMSATARILIGQKILKPAGVLVWTE